MIELTSHSLDEKSPCTVYTLTQSSVSMAFVVICRIHCSNIIPVRYDVGVNYTICQPFGKAIPAIIFTCTPPVAAVWFVTSEKYGALLSLPWVCYSTLSAEILWREAKHKRNRKREGLSLSKIISSYTQDVAV